jgi:arylamine N-acetyltransferase
MISNQPVSTSLIDRYLELLHIQREAPSLDYLSRLVQAQLRYIPYENISKILRLKAGRPGIPSFEEFIELHQDLGYGGTCYVQNGYFVGLLNNLGFEAEILGVGKDVESATHPTCRVSVGEKKYIVDLGNFSAFAGPFSLEPGTVVEAQVGEWLNRYLAGPDATHEMSISRDGKPGRSWRSHSLAREFSFFEPAMLKTFSKDTLFMSTIACYRVFNGNPVYQWGPTLVDASGSELKKTKLADIEDLERIYAHTLKAPKFQVREAVEFLRDHFGVDIFVPPKKSDW